MPTTTVSARLELHEAKELESLASFYGQDRSSLIKSLLRRGLRELRLDQACQAYREEKASLSKAAEIAGVGVREFMALMPERHLDLHYDVAEFDADLEAFGPRR